jgi:hypothetical protein
MVQWCSGVEGGAPSSREVALGDKGAPWPAQSEGEAVRWAVHVGRSGQRTGKTWWRLTEGQETGGADKMHGEGPFYSCVGRGWMGWMGELGLGS